LWLLLLLLLLFLFWQRNGSIVVHSKARCLFKIYIYNMYTKQQVQYTV
jgi:hypothetical protein